MSAIPSRILVVDDHPTNRLKMSMAVKRLGHAVDAAEDGRGALAQLRTGRHDLVLLDLLMPELDGYQVLQAMKDDPRLRTIPVIVISSVEEMGSVVRAIELGAEDYLPKNFDPVLLRARVETCLEVDAQARGAHRVEEDGKRILLFQVVQDLLLFMAQRDRQARVRVTLGRRDDAYGIEIESEGAGVDFDATSGWGPDLLEHVRERLWQVEGQLELAPEQRRVKRLAITVPVESETGALREAAE